MSHDGENDSTGDQAENALGSSQPEFGGSVEQPSADGDCLEAKDATRLNSGRRANERSWLSLRGESLCRVLVIGLCLSTTVTLLARHHWVADLLANLRLQQVIGLGTLLLLSIFIRRWRVSAIAFTLLLVHLPWFSTAFPVADHSNVQNVVSRSDIFDITVANVLTQNGRHDLVLQEMMLRDAHVFAVLELSPDLAAYLESAMGDRYPHVILRPQATSNFGIGLFSRSPLRDAEVFSTHEGIDSIAATVTVAGHPYRVLATHPLPPMNAGLFRHRNHQLQDLADRLASFQSRVDDVPVVVVGDLNLTPWSPWFSDFQERANVVRAIDQFTVQPTWYRYNSFPFGLVLDHCLCDPDLECLSYEIGSDIGSDHRSVSVRLALSNDAAERPSD